MKIGVSLPVREFGDDIDLIVEFAQAAEELGLTHLRVPEQVYRTGSGPLHESMTMMTYIAAVTSKIELVPSVIMLPARPTVLVAKQAANLKNLIIQPQPMIVFTRVGIHTIAAVPTAGLLAHLPDHRIECLLI